MQVYVKKLKNVLGNLRTSSEVNGSFAEMLTDRREKSTPLTQVLQAYTSV